MGAQQCFLEQASQDGFSKALLNPAAHPHPHCSHQPCTKHHQHQCCTIYLDNFDHYNNNNNNNNIASDHHNCHNHYQLHKQHHQFIINFLFHIRFNIFDEHKHTSS